jgi:excisionase family DNA binding protein
MVRASKVATSLGISARTVKRAIERGDIPGLSIGSLYLVNAAWFASVTSWPPSAQEVTT